jgi:hypothetical protein
VRYVIFQHQDGPCLPVPAAMRKGNARRNPDMIVSGSSWAGRKLPVWTYTLFGVVLLSSESASTRITQRWCVNYLKRKSYKNINTTIIHLEIVQIRPYIREWPTLTNIHGASLLYIYIFVNTIRRLGTKIDGKRVQSLVTVSNVSRNKWAK